MRFDLVDQISELVPSRSIRARKVTSKAEELWEEGPHGPVMPGPLVLESLCQAGAWLVNASTEGRGRAALGSIGSFQVLGRVHPGDVLDITGHVVSMNDEMAVLSGTVSVGGQAVLTGEDILCVVLEAGRLEDPADTSRRLRLIRGDLD